MPSLHKGLLLRIGTFDSLKVGDFRWFFLSSIASFMVMQMQQVARGWLIYDLTGSPLALGLVMLSFAGPMLLFSLFGGILADRFSKVELMMVAEGFNVAFTLVLALLIHVHLVTFWHLLVIGFFKGTSMALQLPSRQVIVNEIVGEDRLMNALALNSSGSNLSRIVGPALAGVLIGVIGTAAVFYLMAGISLLSILFISRISVRKPGAKALKSVGGDIREGFKYVRKNGTILSLIMIIFVPMMIGMMAYQNVMPAWSVEALNLGPEGLGLLMAMTGVGAVLGALFVASLGNFRRRGMLLMGAILILPAFLIAFSQSHNLAAALVFLVAIGFLSSTYMSLNQSLVQIYTSPEMRGRVMSITMMAFGFMPLGVLPVSALAERVGTPDALAFSSLLLFLFALAFGVLNPRLRRIE